MTPRSTGIMLATAALLLAACSDGGGSGDQTVAGGPPPANVAGQAAPGQGEVAPSGITVTGQGRVTGRPDTLHAAVGVEVTAPSVQAALDRVNERASAVIQALREAGVDQQDIQTRDVSLHQRHEEPRPEPAETPPADEAPFVARNLVEVKISDLDRAGEVLQAAVEAGGDAARLRGVRFAIEDSDELLTNARERAFADARAKAEHYARLADRGLGALQAISESTGGPPPPAFGGGEVARPEEIPVEPGQQELFVQVTAIWAFE